MPATSYFALPHYPLTNTTTPNKHSSTSSGLHHHQQHILFQHSICPLTPPAISEPSLTAPTAPPSDPASSDSLGTVSGASDASAAVAALCHAPAIHRSFSSPKATSLLSQVVLRSRAASDDHTGSPGAKSRPPSRNRAAAEEAETHLSMLSNEADPLSNTTLAEQKASSEGEATVESAHESNMFPTRRATNQYSPTGLLRTRRCDVEKQREHQHQHQHGNRESDTPSMMDHYVSFPAFEAFYA